jgi:gas vesicle protein
MILPRTGERVKKTFTLRRSSAASNGSTEFLLAPGRVEPGRHRHIGAFEKFKDNCKGKINGVYAFVKSPTGINILKCSLAYILGSLATFVPPISGLLGKNDGKHMVATVTVYFHPARSAGSMAEAILLAFAAFIYAAVVSFTSMAVSIFFDTQHLLVLGHVIVLIMFCGGGLGLVGWTKQKLGNPLVNVGCSLASLALITVLTKEGAVQEAKFSYNKIWQVLKMVFMGTVFSAAVSLLIRPTSARLEFRDTFIKATDAMGEMMTLITRSFLSGSEQDLRDNAFIKASNQSRATFKTLVKNLGEAKYEHYILGTEEEYNVEARLVKCLEQLIQSIGGLRSAADTQFTLLAQAEQSFEPGILGSGTEVPTLGKRTPSVFSDMSPGSGILSPSLSHMERRTSILASIDELPENSVDVSADVSDDESVRGSGRWKLPQEVESNLTSSDMFSIFIAHLGPPMVSVYILFTVLITN